MAGPPWQVVRTESKAPYIAAIVPDHPNSDSRGRVYLHRIIVENRIGRLLTPDEDVHHVNEDKTDNRDTNLAVMLHTKHAAHHSKTGRAMVECVCAYCGLRFQREQRLVHPGLQFCCRRHGGRFYRGDPPHGTYGRYRQGCSCGPCRQANAARMARYRAK